MTLRNVSVGRLASVRAILARDGVDGMLVPRADEHLGEYVPAGAERLAWLTGFTGSAGLAVVLRDRAAVFTDGRYTLQLAEQTDPALFEPRHIVEEPPASWIAATAPGMRIGYSPWLHSEDGLRPYLDAGIKLVPLDANPIDEVWPDRPVPPRSPAVPHPIEYAGRSTAEKRAEVAAALETARQDAAVLTDPASIAWLLNIRGHDVPYTPLALSFALVKADRRVSLFIDRAKLGPDLVPWLGSEVEVRDPDELAAALAALAGRRVRVDPSTSPAWFAQTLRAAGAEPVSGSDPCSLLKAQKNAVEQDGARAAHARDAVALCRFLHWLGGAVGTETETSAADRLLAFRAELPLFQGESFPAISGAGEHGAIIHYRVTPESDRALRRDEVYLIDSGAQYLDGTTDVIRTVWTGPNTPPDAVRERFTRVLQGHIALATLRFPEGVSGSHLDAFARRALWQAGLDYDHGTGHGVGSFLSVHEGPASLSRAGRIASLAAGMILSDEPGYYEPGAYGIRLENLLLVQRADLPHARKPFLQFETLTLAPFDRALLDPGLLAPDERAWLDAYHARVLREIGPELDGEVAAWLERACAPL